MGLRRCLLFVRVISSTTRSHERRALRSVAKELGVQTVGANEVLYHDKLRRPLQDILACIRGGKVLSEAGHTICANAEHDLKSTGEIEHLFADDLAGLRRTLEIAEQCVFSLDDLRYRYPEEHLPSGRSEQGWLQELTLRGARTRYQGKVPADVRAQLERELQIIRKLDYGGYFLTMHEIVQYCREQDILCPRPWQRRQQRSVFLFGHHRNRSRAHGPLVRTLLERRARGAS